MSTRVIQVAMVGAAVSADRLCAPFYEEPGLDATDIDHLFDVRHECWEWEFPRSDRVLECALVDVDAYTLEPTDDGDPDELQLCEQAQREDS